ncbi:MAG: 30S ribosomal protein S3 [Parcubacteria group bacterium]|nr:30S ribosomal protein S3 [Parcubacteria group bacterium]
MGNKIRPDAMRLGITKNWNSRWFKTKNVPQLLEEDVLIRAVIKDKIAPAGIARVEIERAGDSYKIFIKAAKPGLVIGRGGKGIEELTRAIEKRLSKFKGGKKTSLSLNVEELKRTEISAAVVAQNIAWDLERRQPARRLMKKCLESVMQNRDVKGAKIRFSGRIDGAEISRREWLAKGSMPLQTLRADIDYGTATAFTTSGTVGVKVWIYKGEVFE